MYRSGMRTAVAGASVVAALLLAGSACGEEPHGCAGFDPSSEPIAVGDTSDVTVRRVNGGWDSLDFAGAYWSGGDPARLPDGRYEAQATLLSAGSVSSPGSGSVLVDLGENGRFKFVGPVTCA